MLIDILVTMKEGHGHHFNGKVAEIPNVGDIIELEGMILQMKLQAGDLTQEELDYLFQRPLLVERVVKRVVYEDSVIPELDTYATIHLKSEE